MPLNTEVPRHYETVVLVHPDTSDAGQDTVRDRINDIIVKRGGKIARWETWGKRRLAYEVAKQNKAHYIYVNYVSPQTAVAEVERNLRILEPVILYQTVRLQDMVDMEAFDFEAEGKARTALYMSPEDAAAMERSYQREREWAEGGRGRDHDDDDDDDDEEE